VSGCGVWGGWCGVWSMVWGLWGVGCWMLGVGFGSPGDLAAGLTRRMHAHVRVALSVQMPAILRRRIVESERETPAGVKEITQAFEASFRSVIY
jgi:hypothetical protein